ncbi:hypothetical protein M413DRAFT_149486 [Hebeloma cylindrosporum]|uniref:Uncharacterized protein n=1 Tax=Hebeloma cylindrosporum TaxID=76867 RepID=A0A0C2XUX5_HEBCY|nr:hypothetical protein M413DRAFT_149486 [Hebeloma cylindrosporum h7]
MPFFVYRQLEANNSSMAMLSNLPTLRVAINPTEYFPEDLVASAGQHYPQVSTNARVGSAYRSLFRLPFFDGDILELLQACPSLVNCKIQVTDSFDAQPSVVVCLPHLEKLKIPEHTRPPLPALRSIKVPSLIFFQYENPENQHVYGLSTQPGSEETIRWFIENSASTLKSLAICPSAFRQIALPLLQHAVGITHLHIGWFLRPHLFAKR